MIALTTEVRVKVKGKEVSKWVTFKGCKNELARPLKMVHDHWKYTLLSQGAIHHSHIQKESKTDPSNYHPISLTSHIIKIFERVVRKTLVVHLETNNLLSGTQQGFRKGCSCLTQLLQHHDEILNNLNNSDETVPDSVITTS